MSAPARPVTIVCLSPLWKGDLRSRLGPGFDLEAVDSQDDEACKSALRDAQIVIASEFGKTHGAMSPALELLICPAAGTESIDRSALPPGAAFVNGPGQEIPIAEHVIGALVALRHRFFESDRALRRGEWAYGYWQPKSFIEEVHDSSLGLIGYGRIGKEIVKRAVAFGIRCRALTLHPERAHPPAAAPCEIGPLADAHAVDELVSGCDALVVCCELSTVTKGLIDARRFALMRRSAVLINVARGSIVEEQALHAALRDRRIAGAALDVWYQYPPKRGERAFPSALAFAGLDNVIMTPHCSGWTVPARDRKLAFVAAAIEEFARTRKDRA